MVDDQRHVGIGRFADRLAVVERLDEREKFEIGLELVGYLVENARAILDRGLAPGVLGRMGGVERELDVGARRARNLAQLLAGDRARIVEIAPLDRKLS
jgi:hypothetical protein